MPYHDRIPPKTTNARLREMLVNEMVYSKAKEDRVKFLEQRRTELQHTNNRYLERARKAEADNVHLYKRTEEVIDELAELKGERERDIILHLEQQTWARIELNKATEARDYWIREATNWAKTFAKQRQNLERYEAQMNVWVAKMKAFARDGLVLDLIICGFAFLIIAGVVPPVFR